jgi:hypothetical protein
MKVGEFLETSFDFDHLCNETFESTGVGLALSICQSALWLDRGMIYLRGTGREAYVSHAHGSRYKGSKYTVFFRQIIWQSLTSVFRTWRFLSTREILDWMWSTSI